MDAPDSSCANAGRSRPPLGAVAGRATPVSAGLPCHAWAWKIWSVVGIGPEGRGHAYPRARLSRPNHLGQHLNSNTGDASGLLTPGPPPFPRKHALPLELYLRKRSWILVLIFPGLETNMTRSEHADFSRVHASGVKQGPPKLPGSPGSCLTGGPGWYQRLQIPSSLNQHSLNHCEPPFFGSLRHGDVRLSCGSVITPPVNPGHWLHDLWVSGILTAEDAGKTTSYLQFLSVWGPSHHAG